MAPYIEAGGMDAFSFYGNVFVDCGREGDQPTLILEGAGDDEHLAVQDFLDVACVATIHSDENGAVFLGTPTGAYKSVHEVIVNGGTVLATENI